jgi:hypothetical protein
VAAELVRRFGDPGDGQAEQLTEEALRSLAEMALVELDEEIEHEPRGRPA